MRKIAPGVDMYSTPAYGSKTRALPVMALSVDGGNGGRNGNSKMEGLVREITKREGDVEVPGYIDRSKLAIVESSDGLYWRRAGDLEIRGIDEVVKSLETAGKIFLGLEDPDIWTDEEGRKHVYFTLPFRSEGEHSYDIFLGHAEGPNLRSLTATPPILSPIGEEMRGFKEVAISPASSNGSRMNLAEAYIKENGKIGRSVIATFEASNMSRPWRYVRTSADPKLMDYDWCAGHLSPSSILPKDFINVRGLLVGVINGREREEERNGIKFGKFRVGLCLYDSQAGIIPWISKDPLFEDPAAKTITFASDFLRTGEDEGILYAHVDDSFVRVYRINAKELKQHLPQTIEKKEDKDA